MELTDEQTYALQSIVRGVRAKDPVQTLGGYAGTGKTTFISELINCVKKPKVCTYTGKAADVLRAKGVPASTIHSLIYEPIEEHGYVTFKLREKIDDCEVIIVDEASWVGALLFQDLLSFKIPIVFVGDHGQLEPISGDDFNLMKEPMYRLETIHRNSGDIARFADWLRHGNNAVDFKGHGAEVILHKKEDIRGSVILTSVNQIICGLNKTRVGANIRMRELMGLDPMMPTPGDRVICLRNDRKLGLFNGMQGRLNSIVAVDNSYVISFNCDGTIHKKIYIAPDRFNSLVKPIDAMMKHSRDMRIPFDYAYCITCHKFQGSETNKIMVLEQRASWNQARWAYTAASRAREQIHWVIGY